MSAQGKRNRGRKLLAIAVLSFLALLSTVNFKIVKGPIWKFIQHDLTFKSFVDEVQKGYLSDSFAYKNDFVNINGLFARLTGRRVLNNVVKLNNGMLSATYDELNMTALANSITDLSDYLSEQNIPFLYVQVPYKESLDGQSFPTGITTYGNRNADNLLSLLSAEEVETLDLRPLLSQTPEMLEQYFYKTDHHWNSDGSFVAFQEILNYLHELFPESNIDLTYAQTDQWERRTINDSWNLGYWGERVGIYFGGTDPLIWHIPKFETEMSCAIPKYAWFYRGDFTEANIRSKFIEEKNYFGFQPYYLYIGGNYPLVQHRNPDAPSPLKVMMIKDSFVLPLQSYLSTVFQEVDVIDPRSKYSPEHTVAEYVDQMKPDVVIFAINPSVFEDKSYLNLGVENVIPISAEESSYELIIQQDIEVKASNYEKNCTVYPLEVNTVYRVTFDGVDILEGEIEGVQLRLFNRTAKTVLENTIFDIAYCEATDGFTWAIRTPDTQNELELLFYAGIYGSTAGNGVIYRNVTVEKMHSSDT